MCVLGFLEGLKYLFQQYYGCLGIIIIYRLTLLTKVISKVGEEKEDDWDIYLDMEVIFEEQQISYYQNYTIFQ